MAGQAKTAKISGGQSMARDFAEAAGLNLLQYWEYFRISKIELRAGREKWAPVVFCWVHSASDLLLSSSADVVGLTNGVAGRTNDG